MVVRTAITYSCTDCEVTVNVRPASLGAGLPRISCGVCGAIMEYGVDRGE